MKADGFPQETYFTYYITSSFPNADVWDNFYWGRTEEITRSEKHQIYSKDASFVEISLKYKAKRRIHTSSSPVTHKGKLHCGGSHI